MAVVSEKVVFGSHLSFSCCRSLVLAMWVEKHQVLPRYKQCWRVPGEDLLVDMTSGKQVGSRRSCSIRLGSSMVYLWMIGRRVGLLTIKADHYHVGSGSEKGRAVEEDVGQVALLA